MRKTPTDIMREVRVRPAMSVIERIATESIRQIAMEGREATQPELCAATGTTYQSGTISAILARLETKGYIIRKSYQRGLHLGLILEDGSVLWTAEPKCIAQHWRDRTDRVASPPAHTLKAREPTLMQWAESFARRIDIPLTELLERACAAGLDAIRIEQNEGESA